MINILQLTGLFFPSCILYFMKKLWPTSDVKNKQAYVENPENSAAENQRSWIVQRTFSMIFLWIRDKFYQTSSL